MRIIIKQMGRIDFNDGTSVELEIANSIVECRWSDGEVTVMNASYFRELVEEAVKETLQRLRDDGVEVEIQKKHKTLYKG